MDFGAVGGIRHNRLAQFALPGTSFRSQDMAGKCMTALDFAGTRLLEPLSCTLMGLKLWHCDFLKVAAGSGGTSARIAQNLEGGILSRTEGVRLTPPE
jgi:hypothetical protein